MKLLYFSPLHWENFSQRPHHFATWFHKKYDGEILWIDPYPTRFPRIADLKEFATKNICHNTKKPEWLSVVTPKAIPIEPLPFSAYINHLFWQPAIKAIDKFIQKKKITAIGVGKPSLMALYTLKKYPHIYSFYDAMDNFPAFYTGWSHIMMARREQAIAHHVSLTLVSSTILMKQFQAYNVPCQQALNACIHGLPTPVNSNNHLKNNRPILGYIGTIGKWFDWNLVYQLAQANPKMRICLIGPVHNYPPRTLPVNIEILPACEHKEAIKAMQTFSIGLIPFKKTVLTNSVDPIKYYEYRAMGLPVLSTAFGEMMLRRHEPGVYIMDRHQNLKELTIKALSFKHKPYDIIQFRNQNTWEARFDATRLFCQK
ncbi:MAG: hypothetical protein RBR13_06360 [Tenuifilaceae bacterium]|nr:hypothetical protein [Tenuifilaceae bacterium]